MIQARAGFATPIVYVRWYSPALDTRSASCGNSVVVLDAAGPRWPACGGRSCDAMSKDMTWPRAYSRTVNSIAQAVGMHSRVDSCPDVSSTKIDSAESTTLSRDTGSSGSDRRDFKHPVHKA